MTYCCDDMKEELERKCDEHPDRRDCGDNAVVRYEDGKYGLIIHDGTHAHYAIQYCPWCGTNLAKHEEKP